MWGRIGGLVVGVMLAHAVCEAQTNPCPAADDTRIDRVYFELNPTSARPFKPEGLLAVFSADLTPPMDSVSARMWKIDVTPGGTQFRTPVRFGDILEIRPRTTGWSFNDRGEPVVRQEPVNGVDRCAAVFGFNATPAWSVHVVPTPREIEVEVQCPKGVCDSDTTIELYTDPVPETDRIAMKLQFGLVCTYQVDLAPYETVKDLTVDMLLTNCDHSNILSRETRRKLLMKVPHGGIAIRPDTRGVQPTSSRPPLDSGF